MKRIVLDAGLFILFLLVMSFQFLPKVLHEVLGIVIALAMCLHLVWNFRWFFTLTRGRWNLIRLVSTVVNILFIASMLITLATGLFISNYLCRGWFGLFLQRDILVHQLHVSLPYAMMILMGLHLGLHWQGLWRRFVRFIKLDIRKSVYRVACYLLTAVFIIAGIYGSFTNRIGDHLLMKHMFGSVSMHSSFAGFIFLALSVIVLYAAVGYALQQLMVKNRI